MRPIIFLASATLGLAVGSSAGAFPCGTGSECTKYGLGAPDSFGKEPDPIFAEKNPTLTPSARDFVGSYTFSKDVSGPFDQRCDGEGGYVPVFGQIVLRDQVGCVPTEVTGCPVEIALDLNPPPTQSGSETESYFADSRLIFVNAELFPGFFVQMWISTASHGRIHAFGQRFRIGAGPATRVQWTRLGTDALLDLGPSPLRRGDSRSKVCCHYVGGFDLCQASGLVQYPPITDPAGLGSAQKNIPDFIFEAGAGSNWRTDETFVAAGQQHGVCKGDPLVFTDDAVSRSHRRVGCDTDVCVSRGQTCTDSDPGPAVALTCGGVPAPAGISCTPNVDECNNPTATCDVASGFCNTGAGEHISDDVPCTSNADCDLNDVCDLSEGGYRLQSLSTLLPLPSEGSAIGSCINDPRIQCTQGACACSPAPCTPPATCECAIGGVGGDCSLARVPNTGICGEALFYFRGTANQNCSLIASFLDDDQCAPLAGEGQQAACVAPVANDNGTPGNLNDDILHKGRQIGSCGLRPLNSPPSVPFTLTSTACERDGEAGLDCMARNYGPHNRPDVDCDGDEDATIDTSNPKDGIPDVIGDLCPNIHETDPFSDTDRDGRGDECQCGDSTTPVVQITDGQYSRTRDGEVTVSDIVSTNVLIFNDPAQDTGSDGLYRVSAPLCDSNGDDLCTVSDIVGTNLEVFSTGYTAKCFRFPCPEPLTRCTSTGAPLP